MKTLQKASVSPRNGLLAKGLVCASILVLVAGCAGGNARRAAMAGQENTSFSAKLYGTPLDVDTPKPTAVEARMSLAAAGGTQGLSNSEYNQITSFGADYARVGHGNLVISIPMNAGNSQTAAMVAQDAQRALYAAGVDYSKISSATYQAQGQPQAPVLIAYERYEVKKLVCEPWSSFSVASTNSNLSPNRFGCAQNANLSAMVADPRDLLSDRSDPQTSNARPQQVGVGKYLDGTVAAPTQSTIGSPK